jgi:hypothetical protein
VSWPAAGRSSSHQRPGRSGPIAPGPTEHIKHKPNQQCGRGT